MLKVQETAAAVGFVTVVTVAKWEIGGREDI